MRKTYYWKVAMSWTCSLSGEINAYIDTVLVGQTLRK